MPVTTNAGFDSAAASPALGVLYLVEMEFASGTQYLTNWPTNVTVGATTYTGLGNLGKVGTIKESEDGAVQTLDLELSQVNASLLSLALGSVENYQGRPVRVFVAVTNEQLVVAGAPVLRFAGFMNIVKLPRGTGGKGSVVMQCATGGYDLRGNPVALRMNDAQHQSRFPGELGFVYAADLIARPQQWLSKRFQQV